MGKKIVLLGLILTVVLIGGCVKQEAICKEGFTLKEIEGFPSASMCESEKTDFECTGNLAEGDGKGIPITVCGYTLGYEDKKEFDIENLIEKNNTIRVKGKFWESYRPCDNTGMQAQMSCGPASTESTTDIESLEIVE